MNEPNQVTIKTPPTGPDAPVAGDQQQKQAAQPSTPDRPTWLPEKFKSPEDLAKAYAELEKKQGAGRKEGEQQEQQQQEQEQNTPQDKGQEPKTLTEKAKAEYAKNGKLSDETYAALASAGIDKEMVDAYIEAQSSRAAASTKAIYDIVGGEDAYAEMTAWASENLSSEEIDAFDRAVTSGDAAQVKLAVRGLVAEFRRAVPAAPKRAAAGSVSPNSGAVEPFRSTAQLVEAMKDPRYKSDPAYRQVVEERLAVSDISQ